VYVAKVNENLQPVPETEHFIPCDTLLLSVGLIPENELSKKIGVALSPLTGGAYVNNRLETSIPGVFAAGNALHVHDLVDFVTEEAYEAAENAALFIKGGQRGGQSIPVTAKDGVRYTVPTTLVWDGPETGYTLSFRSDKVYSSATIKILADGRPVKTQKKRVIIPSEMERVRFSLKEPAGEVTVAVEQGADI
jgi:hypothetical protein